MMKSAERYIEQIEKILGINLEEDDSYLWDYETVPEAEEALADMADSLERLEELRRELNADMKAIRDDYRDKMANAAAGSSTAMSLLGRKQKAGQMKADAKRQLRAKRNEALAPYNEVKSILDRIIPDVGKQATSAQKFVDSGDGAQTEEMTEPERRSTDLATFYLATPPAGSQMELQPMLYTALKPIEPPQEFVFNQPKPAAPELKEAGLRGIFSGSRRQHIEEENRQLLSAYEGRLKAWSEAKDAAEASYTQEKESYQGILADWLDRKKTFDAAEAERVRQLEEARQEDPGTMRALLGRRLDSLTWPPELDMAYANEYTIEKGGSQLHLEVRVPGQDSWGDSQAASGAIAYPDLVHAIAFRLVGELFYVLPAAKEVVISAFEEDSGRSGHHDGTIFLLSSKVSRDAWDRIDFVNLEYLDLLGCFASFKIRSKMTEAGRLLQVDRFRR
jgi:hypothetical protein